MTDTSRALKPVLDFLQQYSPFKQMLPVHQEYLAMHLEQVFYAGNENIIVPQDGTAECFYIIKSGSVSTESLHETKNLSPGDYFPVAALLDKSAVDTPFQAVKSTICYRLTQPNFEYLMQQSIIFHDTVSREKS